jgi:molecular chaperone Hsp33
MDRIVRWINGTDELRACLVEAGALEATIRDLHQLPEADILPMGETVLGTLLFAQDLKSHQTLSTVIEHDGRSWHCDATPEGLARAMISGSSWEGSGTRITVRRFGQKGLIYQSVVESAEATPLLALREYLEVSEQSPAHLSCFLDPLAGRAEAFLLRGFPDTPVELLGKALVALDAMTPSTPVKDLLHAAFDGRWDILNETSVEHHCPCSRERAAASLATLGAAELEEAAAQDGELGITCEFCKTRYGFEADELLALSSHLRPAP